MVKNCKAETRGMESNRDRVIQWKWMALTITQGGRALERERKKSKERTERGGNDWRLCGKRDREQERERERGEGLKKYELVYDLAAGSIKKGEDCKQDVVMPTLFFFGFNEDKLLQDLSEGDFFCLHTWSHVF